MKVTINNLEQLYELDRILYNQIKQYIGGGGIYRINVSVDLPIAFAEAVNRFQSKNLIELWDEQKKQAELEARKADVAKGVKAAIKQYNVWLQQGLEDTPANSDLVAKWVAANFTHASPYAVDAAIRTLGPSGTEQLAWKKASVAPEPAPAPMEPPPPPRLLSDGKPELPLGTPVSTRYSVEQLRDLDRRTREEAKKLLRAHNNQVATEFNAARQPITLEV